MFNLLIPPFLGMLYRIRGGYLPTGSTTLARALWTLGLYGAFLLIFPFVWWHAPIMLFLIFATHAWFGHGQWMDVGRNNVKVDLKGPNFAIQWVVDKFVKSGTKLSDMLCMGILGGFRHIWALPMAFLDPCIIIYMVGGLFHGVVYELGWRIPSTIKGFKRGPELAEVLIGLLHGVLLVIVGVL